MIEYVKKQQKLNDIEIDIPQAPIDQVLDDPEQYGYDLIEKEFANYVSEFQKAYNLGKKFGKEVIDGGKAS